MASACVLIMANEQLMLRPIQNLKSRASTCIIISIAVVCVCILVVCGVMIAREYSLATDYKEASCRLANTTARNDIICWYCANNKVKTNDKGGTMPNCVQSQFPCIQISVAYTVQSQLQHSVLHPDSIQATGPYNQCSYSICLKNKEDNVRAVEQFAAHWSSMGNRSFVCYYDMETLDNVIVQKVYSQTDVIHSMLWPSLALVMCAVVFLYLETSRRHLTCCGRETYKQNGSHAPDTVYDDVERHDTSHEHIGFNLGNLPGTSNEAYYDRKLLKYSKISKSMTTLEKWKVTEHHHHQHHQPHQLGDNRTTMRATGLHKSSSVDRLREFRTHQDRMDDQIKLSPSTFNVLESARMKNYPAKDSSDPGNTWFARDPNELCT